MLELLTALAFGLVSNAAFLATAWAEKAREKRAKSERSTRTGSISPCMPAE